MNIRNLLLTASLAPLLVTGISAASPDTPGSTTVAKVAAAAPAGPESALKPGMPAETVTQLMGKPEEIRPMQAPNGKAEIWVFTRQISTRMERVGFPSADVVTTMTGSDGKSRSVSTPGPVIYHDVQYVTVETVEVLLFNNHYVTHKVMRAERQFYQ